MYILARCQHLKSQHMTELKYDIINIINLTRELNNNNTESSGWVGRYTVKKNPGPDSSSVRIALPSPDRSGIQSSGKQSCLIWKGFQLYMDVRK